MFVVKANDLIRKTRYNLTTQQQKIILFAISKIKPNDAPTQKYEISIDELCDACGIDLDSGGTYYKTIKEDLQKLTTRLWVQMPDKSESTVSWICDADIIPLKGTVDITFHPKMAPYLFELHERYTQYQLEKVLVFKSKYAIRLYEILRSYMTQQEIDNGIEKEIPFSLEELREVLAINSYSLWADFDRFVIRKAINEINLFSDEIHIDYDTYKTKGKKIDKIIFIITKPRALQIIQAHEGKRQRLNKAPL